jgi:predicted transcriptional regulator
MSTEQLLLRLPNDLVRRFKQIVPARQRSAFVRQLLEQALPSADSDHDPLYLAALAVEQDMALGEEMAEWEAATINDGLTEAPPSKRPI